MATSLIRPVQHDDIAALAANLREIDKKEIRAKTDQSFYDVVYESVEASAKCYTCEINDEMAAIFGVGIVNITDGHGIIWMLGTDVLRLYPREVMNCTDAMLPLLERGFSKLENFVSVENLRSLKWLRKIGYEIGEPIDFGRNGEQFVRISKCVV